MNRILHHTILPGTFVPGSLYMQRNFPAKRSGRDADGLIIGNDCNAAKKENIVKINNIHENSNNYNKYTNDSSDEAKSAGKAETILRAMTADDLPAVERIEQTCFSDACSEKLLSDMLESEWDEPGCWRREEFRDRVCKFPVSRRGRGAYEDRCASGIQGTWGVKEIHGSSGNLFKGERGTGFDSGGACREHACDKPL